MALYKINDFDPNYRNTPNSDAIQNFDVYTDRNEKVGKVIDALLDQAGNFRYLVVDVGSWMTGKQVLVPVGRSQVDARSHRIYVSGLTREQVANLPPYHTSTPVDYQHEQQVRTVYRTRSIEESAPLEASGALEGPRVVYRAPVNPPAPVASTPDAYSYQQDPELYELNERNHQPFVQYQEQLRANRHQTPDVVVPPAQSTVPQPIYDERAQGDRVLSEDTIPLKEERLVVDRQKRKVGEVVVRKEIETEYIQVPVQREKLIVEEVGAEPKQLAEIDLHEQNQLADEWSDSVDPNDPRVIRSDRRSP